MSHWFISVRSTKTLNYCFHEKMTNQNVVLTSKILIFIANFENYNIAQEFLRTTNGIIALLARGSFFELAIIITVISSLKHLPMFPVWEYTLSEESSPRRNSLFSSPVTHSRTRTRTHQSSRQHLPAVHCAVIACLRLFTSVVSNCLQ